MYISGLTSCLVPCSMCGSKRPILWSNKTDRLPSLFAAKALAYNRASPGNPDLVNNMLA